LSIAHQPEQTSDFGFCFGCARLLKAILSMPIGLAGPVQKEGWGHYHLSRFLFGECALFQQRFRNGLDCIPVGGILDRLPSLNL